LMALNHRLRCNPAVSYLLNDCQANRAGTESGLPPVCLYSIFFVIM
jgi:hypothetical protein